MTTRVCATLVFQFNLLSGLEGEGVGRSPSLPSISSPSTGEDYGRAKINTEGENYES
jgi:hypothetical protein